MFERWARTHVDDFTGAELTPTGIETIHGSHPLGAWAYSIWRPRGLVSLVDHMWAFVGPTTHLRKRILPNGCIELLLNFADRYRLLEGRGDEFCRFTWLSGPQVGPLVIEQPRKQDVVGVRLRLPAAYSVLGLPVSEVAGLCANLADVVGASSAELADRCAAAGSVAARFQLVEQWLRVRLVEAARGIDKAVTWAVARLDESAGTVPIAALRAHTRMSKVRLV